MMNASPQVAKLLRVCEAVLDRMNMKEEGAGYFALALSGDLADAVEAAGGKVVREPPVPHVYGGGY